MKLYMFTLSEDYETHNHLILANTLKEAWEELYPRVDIAENPIEDATPEEIEGVIVTITDITIYDLPHTEKPVFLEGETVSSEDAEDYDLETLNRTDI